MIDKNLLLAMIGGFLAGLLLAWLFIAARMNARLATKMAEINSEKGSLLERLQGREEALGDLRHQLAEQEAALNTCRQELSQELSLRATAEERAVRLPELETLLEGKEERIQGLYGENSELKTRCAELQTRMEEEKKAVAEKLGLLMDAQEGLAQAFQALSAQALRSNNQTFLELAASTLEKFQEGARNDLESRQQAIRHLVSPLQESLQKVDQQLQMMEKERISAFTGLSGQVKSLAESELRLQQETQNLVKALRTPQVRGRWGEVQLRRVVEIAGMVEYCDFVQQKSVQADGNMLRPDLLVLLPNHKTIIVDAKSPLQAYLEAVETHDDSLRLERLKDHARQVRTHINQLASKQYWQQFASAPEFVVLFLPGESFFSAALEQDPTLIEYAAGQRVVLATPTTLIALLLAVAYGWRQEQVADNARAISELGKTLYERLSTLGGHFNDLRKALERTVEAYNRASGSLESRVLVAARRFKELGAASGQDLPALQPADKYPRSDFFMEEQSEDGSDQ